MPHLRIRPVLFILCAALLCSLELSAKDFDGRVVGVHDGDTITVLKGSNGKKPYHVRLSGIDAPELGQAFGSNGKKGLSDLVFGKTVRIADHGKDDYGRIIADVYVGEVWVNLAMVEQGLAWRYTHYSHDPKLGAAEVHARQHHLGLWQDKSPTPPWDYRYHEANKGKK